MPTKHTPLIRIAVLALMVALLAAPAQPGTWKVTGSDVTFEMSSKDLRALRDGKEVFGLQSRKADFLSMFKAEAGTDMFGRDTADKSFGAEKGTMAHAKAKVDAGFEFMQKLGVHYYCFHTATWRPRARRLKSRTRT